MSLYSPSSRYTVTYYEKEELYRIEKLRGLMNIHKYDKCHYTHRLVDTQ